MDEFIQSVRSYADALGITPSTVTQRAAGVGGSTWVKWERRTSFPTLKTVDKILNYIEENPAPAPDASSEPLKAAG